MMTDGLVTMEKVRFNVRSARQRQNAFFGRAVSRVNPAPPLLRAVHPDVQIGATIIDSQEGVAPGN